MLSEKGGTGIKRKYNRWSFHDYTGETTGSAELVGNAIHELWGRGEQSTCTNTLNILRLRRR